MSKKVLCYLLVIGLFVSGSYAAALEREPEKEGGELKNVIEVRAEGTILHYRNVIEVRAEGTILHYRKESFWNEIKFSEIMENKTDFISDLIQNFNESLSVYGEGGERGTNAQVEINEKNKSTVLRCDVHGAIRKSGNSYHATFFWLLRPLGLDFIDDHFEESREGLSWEGSVSGIQTTITIKLPPRNVAYAAWQRSIGHCHAHVWWT